MKSQILQSVFTILPLPSHPLHTHPPAPASTLFQLATLESIKAFSSNPRKKIKTKKALTLSTHAIPPLNHLYLLSRSCTHASSRAVTSCSPSATPAGESTIHARGTRSSEVRPPETPATLASMISLSGCARSVFSISTGETCTPETLSVSCDGSIQH